MDQHTFDQLRDLVYRESGIVLKEEKRSLLLNRIQKRLRELQVSKINDYLEIIETDKSGQELVELIDAISTNVTYFYREPEHFTQLGEILSGLDTRDREIKIWCAAASSGEEPYTLAITAAESCRNASWKILGTDICTKVLLRAVAGVYSAKHLENVAPEYKKRYFDQSESGIDQYQVKESLRKHLLFKKLNLIDFPYPLKGSLDVIFCRNVMIYFDVETRNRIVNQIEKLLKPGGHFFISHSESLLGVRHSLSRVTTSVFRKN